MKGYHWAGKSGAECMTARVTIRQTVVIAVGLLAVVDSDNRGLNLAGCTGLDTSEVSRGTMRSAA